jgi:alkanesulfonate monooxygenase SsuD/methylene tetrahydromethanopterin reductase-like flavin-dependent oxidoreductase (luciferase family)
MEIGLLSLGDHLADPTSGAKTTQVERFRSLVESAVIAEQGGFDSVWLGEHHFCDYILSTPPVVLAAIAERTERIRLGTGVTLLANLDPVRVAEDYATVDLLSEGRVELVVGRGILAHTYRSFGQDIGESRPIYAEKLELLLRLWTEENVDWEGQHRSPLQEATVQPRPAQQPHPPIWVGGGSSNDSVDLAARLGLDLMLPSVIAPPQVFMPMVGRYREQLAATGRPGRGRIGAVSHVHVAETSQEAAAWKPYYVHYLSEVTKMVQWSGGAIRPGANSAFGSMPDYDQMFETAAICGSPQQVIDRLGALQEEMALDVHLGMFDLGGLPEADLYRTLELYAEKVLPALDA